jgi:integrase
MESSSCIGRKPGFLFASPFQPSSQNSCVHCQQWNPNYFFWSGNGDPETAKKGWQRALRRLFKRAKIKKPDGTPKRCHPHMFRDTFAVELLLSGVPIDQVSLLLGHSSVKVTEKHYSPFVKARQEQLENSVRLSWQLHTEWLNESSQPGGHVN